MNNYKLEIYNSQTQQWEQYRSEFPLKFANLLDERLDEAEIYIKRTSVPYFLPLTKVRITLTNTPLAKFTQADFERIQARTENPSVTLSYNAPYITETQVLNMVVATDTPHEVPSGSGKYDHQLYLIESTKIMEGFICDTVTFTNALGNDFANNS